MPKKGITAALLSLVAFSAIALDESITIDSSTVVPSSPWPWTLDGISLRPGFRGGMDFNLHHASYLPGPGTDLLVHFDGAYGSSAIRDETGRYTLEPGSFYATSSQAEARLGEGAGIFSGSRSRVLVRPGREALFAANSVFRDFSLEFWIKPAMSSDGETVLSWRSALVEGKGTRPQLLSCVFERSRLAWTFGEFFRAPDGHPTEAKLKGLSLVVPRAWSHHLVRFDYDTGLLEYLVNGVVEDAVHVTSTGREDGSAFYPSLGTAAPIELAPSFTGLIDELRLSSRFVEEPTLTTFSHESGTAISPVVDLGDTGARLLGIEARYDVPGSSGIDFAYRSGDIQAGWRPNDPEWIPFSPGKPLPGAAKGRFVQVMATLYPDGRGTMGPTLSYLTFRFRPDPPPPPPATVACYPKDGAVLVQWSRVPDPDVKGYLVYYGYAPGEYFGAEAVQGASPVDAGGQLSITLSGLKNGALYYIVVAAYDGASPPHIGEFSAETPLRPSRTAP